VQQSQHGYDQLFNFLNALKDLKDSDISCPMQKIRTPRASLFVCKGPAILIYSLTLPQNRALLRCGMADATSYLFQ
jgi:hypothetical protein